MEENTHLSLTDLSPQERRRVVEAPVRRRLDSRMMDAVAYGATNNFTLEQIDAAYQKARQQFLNWVEANRIMDKLIDG